MSVLCIICSENYKSTDDVYSTTCGHIYHYACMQQWRSRSLSCPQCREHNPQTHKIYLTFDDRTDEDLDLRLQLENSLANASLLQIQVDESAQNFVYLQTQLENNLDIMEVLKQENEKFRKDMKKNSIESQHIQDGSAILEPAEGEARALRREIALLEEKLNQVTMQLEKEIRNSTELIVEKMKLRAMLDQNTSSCLSLADIGRKNESKTVNKRETVSVVIRGLPAAVAETQNAIAEYKKVVLKLAKIMGLEMTEGDLSTVSIMENKSKARQNTLFEKITLMVTFKTLDWKIKFLSNKEKLKTNSETNGLTIHEYNTEDINTLFNYAKPLRTVGYSSVYCRNNIVFVKKTQNSQRIVIKNKAQVDELMKTLQNGRTASPIFEPFQNGRTASPIFEPLQNGRTASPIFEPISDDVGHCCDDSFYTI